MKKSIVLFLVLLISIFFVINKSKNSRTINQEEESWVEELGLEFEIEEEPVSLEIRGEDEDLDEIDLSSFFKEEDGADEILEKKETEEKKMIVVER